MTTSADREFECCPAATWTQTENLGTADGVEFTLGRCSVCGRWWMHLWTAYARGPGYAALDERTARELVQMAAGPDRKRRLAELFNS